jgi:hypothetical protein
LWGSAAQQLFGAFSGKRLVCKAWLEGRLNNSIQGEFKGLAKLLNELQLNKS